MCGRFVMEIDKKELDEIFKEVQRNVADGQTLMSLKMEGEIFPTNIVPIKTADGYFPMKWGFDMRGRSVINARSETALEKPMFRTALLERRCLIIASGYYEWQDCENGSKTKYEFSVPGQNTMYLAGCYRRDRDEPLDSFVILTRDATPEFEAIHNRMPVVLTDRQAHAWLESDTQNLTRLMADSLTALEYAAVPSR
jgi:putative SOS response-associated peptidase YedK